MKKIVVSILTAALILGNVSVFALTKEDSDALKEAPAAEKTENVTVTVTESEIIQEEPKNSLGLCWEHQKFSDDNVLGGNGSTELTEEYKNIAADFDGAFYVARTMGSPSSFFHPMDNIGPMNNRKESKNQKLISEFKNFQHVTSGDAFVVEDGEKRAFGPVEWIKAAREINPDTSFIIGLNMVTAGADESAKYAAFLTSPKGTLVDGIDYGALREEYGIGAEPVKVAMYELGNEINWYSTDTQSYVKVAKEHIAAVRAVDPDAKFAYCGACVLSWDEGVTGMLWRSWTLGVAGELADDCEYCTWHFYHDGVSSVESSKYLDQLAEDHMTVAGKEFKIVITEHADWPDNTEGTFSKDPISLEGALNIGNYLNIMYRRSDVWGGTYFLSTEYDAGCWGTFLNIGGKLTMTGAGRAYEFYSKGVGDKVVKTEPYGSELADMNNNEQKFSVASFISGKRDMSMVLVNRSVDTDINVNFEFENNYTLTEENIFTAPNINSYVTSQATKDIFTTTTEQRNEANFNKYTIPAKSMVILKMKSDKDFAGEIGSGDDTDEETAVTGETVFGDLDGHWARGEIETLAANGQINGVENGIFAPEQSVTRAEFAVMLTNALGIEIDDINYNVFKDVGADEWYAKAVNAVYTEGYMRSYDGYFRPQDTLSLEELAVIVSRFVSDTSVTDSEKETILNGFNYQNEISAWAQDGILKAIISGMFNKFYENGEFIPSNKVTRAQAAVIVYRIQKIY